MELLIGWLSFFNILSITAPDYDAMAALPPVHLGEDTKLGIPKDQTPGPNKVSKGVDRAKPSAAYGEGRVLDDQNETFANNPFDRNLLKTEIQDLVDKGDPSKIQEKDGFIVSRVLQTLKEEAENIQAFNETARIQEIKDTYKAEQGDRNSNDRPDDDNKDIAKPKDTKFDLISMQYQECLIHFGKEHCKKHRPDSVFEEAKTNNPSPGDQSLCKDPQCKKDIIGDPNTTVDA